MCVNMHVCVCILQIYEPLYGFWHTAGFRPVYLRQVYVSLYIYVYIYNIYLYLSLSIYLYLYR